MPRIRLRDSRSAEGERVYYGSTYPRGYRHDVWPDHVERVAASVELIRRYESQLHTAADLSCGDGAIIRGLADVLDTAYVGDLNGVPPESLGGVENVVVLRSGALPESLWNIPEAALPVDLLVLSETLEHLDDPDRMLRQATMFARYLFVSTPVEEVVDSGNLEHYWSWGTQDVGQMLKESGWTALELKVLVPESTRHMENAYRYQLWIAVNR